MTLIEEDSPTVPMHGQIARVFVMQVLLAGRDGGVGHALPPLGRH